MPGKYPVAFDDEDSDEGSLFAKTTAKDAPGYRSRYAGNLGKKLPRIRALKRFADFQAFSKAGRDLDHWHLNDETVPSYEGVTLEGSAGTPARSSKRDP